MRDFHESAIQEGEMSAYMFGFAFCCIDGCASSECVPSVAPFMFGIPGIGGGGEVGPLVRLLGGVGVFFGRANGVVVFGAVPGRGWSWEAELSRSSGVPVMSASLADASLESLCISKGRWCAP